jgi:hypothetical protein
MQSKVNLSLSGTRLLESSTMLPRLITCTLSICLKTKYHIGEQQIDTQVTKMKHLSFRSSLKDFMPYFTGDQLKLLK